MKNPIKIEAKKFLKNPEACVRDWENESSIEFVDRLYELGAKKVWFVSEYSDEEPCGDTIYIELPNKVCTDLVVHLVNSRPDECDYEHSEQNIEDYKYIRIWWD